MTPESLWRTERYTLQTHYTTLAYEFIVNLRYNYCLAGFFFVAFFGLTDSRSSIAFSKGRVILLGACSNSPRSRRKGLKSSLLAYIIVGVRLGSVLADPSLGDVVYRRFKS